MEKAASWLSDTLGYQFNDRHLLRQALTHRSAHGPSNERLEFLGDAVLDFVVSEILYRSLPESDEGDLSRLRASLVNDASLAGLAVEIGLGGHLLLGGGEKKSGGHRRESILADALEALFGAVFLDSGISAASTMIERVFGERLQEFPDASELRDPKTRLQEWLQGRGLPLPEYRLVKVSGEAHKQRFEVQCSAGDPGQQAVGEGSSRRNAEQQAARRMLDRLTGRESS